MVYHETLSDPHLVDRKGEVNLTTIQDMPVYTGVQKQKKNLKTGRYTIFEKV